MLGSTANGAVKKHNKRQNKHYGQGGHGGHSSTSSTSYVNCHHGHSGYDGDGMSESSSSDVQYFKSPTKYVYSGTQEDGHDMFDKVLKQIEKSVLKYIKQLENEGKIMLFDTKTQSLYPSTSHDIDTKKKSKKFNGEVFDPSDGFRTDIYNDINSMVFKGGKSVKSNGSGGGNNVLPYRYNGGNNQQQKYSSSSVTSQYYVNEDDYVPSSSGGGGSGPGYDDNYKSSSTSSSTSTTYGDDGCRYSYPSTSQSQPYPSPAQDYNSDGYPIMNPYQFVFNQDKYGRHKKDLGSKCGNSYRH